MPQTVGKEARQSLFLAALADKGVIGPSAEAAGVARQTVHEWRKDPAFLERFEAALDRFADSLQEEALRRGRDGVDEPVVYQGQFSYEYEYVMDEDGKNVLDEEGKPVSRLRLDDRGQPIKASIKRYSDSLLARKLEARVKGYARKTEVTGADGGALQLESSPIDIARKIAFALALGLKAAKEGSPAAREPEEDEGDDLC
jgi:hypothetical protein